MPENIFCPYCKFAQVVEEIDLHSSFCCSQCSQTFTLSNASTGEHLKNNALSTVNSKPALTLLENSNSLIQQIIGGCRIEAKLGQGGMGVVYKAQHLTLDIPVALKTLSYQGDDEFKQDQIGRFIREARSAARLRHPNIVGVLNVGEERGIHYLIMEYVEGKNLLHLLQEKGPLPITQAVSIIQQVGQALEVANKNNIVHRDIKPENILLSTEGTAKLVDLGLAKNSIEDFGLTQSGMAMGTPYYMSPEQAEDSKNVDHQGDIYSLGCTLYQLLTGKVPYEGNSIFQVLNQHINAPIPNPRTIMPQIPEALVKILQKMMAKQKTQRYLNATALLKDVNTFIQKGAQAFSSPATPVSIPLKEKTNPPKLVLIENRLLDTIPLQTSPSKKKPNSPLPEKPTPPKKTAQERQDQMVLLGTLLFVLLFIGAGIRLFTHSPQLEENSSQTNETSIDPKSTQIASTSSTNPSENTENSPLVTKDPITTQVASTSLNPKEAIPEKNDPEIVSIPPINPKETTPQPTTITEEEPDVEENEEYSHEEEQEQEEETTSTPIEEEIPSIEEKKPPKNTTNPPKKQNEKEMISSLKKSMWLMATLTTPPPNSKKTAYKLDYSQMGAIAHCQGDIFFSKNKELVFGKSNDSGILIKSKNPKNPKDMFFNKSSFTISVWFKTDVPDNQRILGRGHYYWSKGFCLGMGWFSPPGVIHFGVASGDLKNSGRESTFIATKEGGYHDNKWHHIVAIYQPNQYLALYIDGKPADIQKWRDQYADSAGDEKGHKLLFSNIKITPDVDDEGITIGNSQKTPESKDCPQQNWKGSLRELMIWKDRVLEEEEIQFLYEHGLKKISRD